MVGVLHHRLDEERRLRERLEIGDHPHAVGAAVELRELLAMLGHGGLDPLSGGGGASPQEYLPMRRGDGGQTGRDRSRAGDGELFLHGISWVEVAAGRGD